MEGASSDLFLASVPIRWTDLAVAVGCKKGKLQLFVLVELGRACFSFLHVAPAQLLESSFSSLKHLAQLLSRNLKSWKLEEIRTGP